MTLADFTDEEIFAEASRRQKIISEQKRKARDHERYLRNRKERISKQKEYYRNNIDEIKRKKREKYYSEKPVTVVMMDKRERQLERQRRWYAQHREEYAERYRIKKYGANLGSGANTTL